MSAARQDVGRAWCLACCVVMGLCAVLEHASSADSTPSPITYIRDYAAGHLDDDTFIEAIRGNTADLLVLGKDAPLHHNWGFVAGTGGENQAFGKGEHIRRLSAAQARQKMARIKVFVGRLHDTGVRWVMPYICTMTIGGHHEQRTGFWEFYDHWEEYHDFALGPRPDADPVEWMQRQADGGLRTYYQWDAPYYAPNYRWAVCVNHPAWRQHEANVVRLAAAVGYDGVYMDNSCSTRCYCSYCQDGFRRYLRQHRPSLPDLLTALDVTSLDDVRLGTDAGTFLWRLSAEYWTESKLDFLRHLKAAGGSARGGDFHIFANTGAWLHGGHEIQRVSQVASCIQSEENGGAAGAHPGLYREPIAGDLFYRTCNRRVVEYKFTQSLRTHLRVTMTTRTTRAGTPWARRAVDQNAQTAALGIAESVAYSGGGAFKMQLRWDANREVRRWREFLDAHRSLFETTVAWAQVGVVAFAEQHYFSGTTAAQAALHECATMLAANHVLFDMIHETQLLPERLRAFGTVVVPAGVKALSDAQLAVFSGYASSGGRLVVMGDGFGSLDERCRPRRGPAVPSAARLPAAVLPEQLLPALGLAGGILRFEEGRTPTGVGVNAYAKPSAERPNAILLHIVNYHVPLGRESTAAPLPVHGLHLRLPLPYGWQARTVESFTPLAGDQEALEWRQEGEVLVARIPSLHLYRLVQVSGSR